MKKIIIAFFLPVTYASGCPLLLELLFNYSSSEVYGFVLPELSFKLALLTFTFLDDVITE